MMISHNEEEFSEGESSSQPQIYEVAPEHNGMRLDAFVAAVGEHSRSRLKVLIEAGNVSVGDEVELRGKRLLRTGESVAVVIPPPVPADPIAQNIPLNVVYEDRDLLVIDKPAGMVVHPGAGTADGTMVNALLGRGEGQFSSIGGVQRPGIVHRLDKDTSGLIVVARNDATHRYLSEALQKREVKRVYQALVLRHMPAASGDVNQPLGRHPNQRTKMAIIEEERGGRGALTHWRVLEFFHGFSYVECQLSTGRTHQIRVHMAHIKHPVLGDELYGGAMGVALQLVGNDEPLLRGLLQKLATRQMLHACRLSFVHPITGRLMEFESSLPHDFARILAQLRKQQWIQ